MQGVIRLMCIICMILILIFAIIHLGVSIGIIGRYHRYGDVFRPEIGLASFNIVISVYAFLIGGFGLFSVLTYRGILSDVVALATILLGLFTLVSLITALIINSLAINYVNSRFFNHMNSYQNSQSSRNTIDEIQTNYDCCGSNTWLDWSGVLPNITQSSTSATTTLVNTTTPVNEMNATVTTTAVVVNNITTTTTIAAIVNETTTTIAAIVNETTTTIAAIVNETAAIVNETTTTAGIVQTNSTVVVKKRSGIGKIINDRELFDNTIESSVIEKDVESKSFENTMEIAGTNPPSWEETTDDFNSEQISPQQIIRRKRQSNYGGIYGLPSSFDVTLPQSCCTTDLSTINSLSNQYCMSSTNNFHTDGCERQLGKVSVDQTLGLAVINSCLFILALAAIALILAGNSGKNSQPYGSVNQPTQQYSQPYGFVNQPTQQYSQPSGFINQPTQQYSQPYGYVNQPTQQYSQPYGYVNQPTQQYSQPYGEYNATSFYPGMPYDNYNYNPVFTQYY